MDTRFVVDVKKIVKEETEDGVSFKIVLKSGGGHKLTLKLDSPAGWLIGNHHELTIHNPQTTLEV